MVRVLRSRGFVWFDKLNAIFFRRTQQHEKTFLLPDKVICFVTLRMVLDVLKVEQRWPLCISTVLHDLFEVKV
jgi:hypothetical protein